MHLLFLLFAIAISTTPVYAAPQLKDLDGSPRALSDFIGKGAWIMVNVWSPGCSHCRDELPTLIEFHGGNVSNAKVLGIVVDYPGFGAAKRDEVATFAAAHQINFPLLLADGTSAGQFLNESIDVVPLTFAFDPKGRMVARWHGVITTPDINEIIRDFSPRP